MFLFFLVNKSVGMLSAIGGLLPVAARRRPTDAGRVIGDGPRIGHHLAIFSIGGLPMPRTYFRDPPRRLAGGYGESMGIAHMIGGEDGRTGQD
jgi:hypothetical protein